MAACKSFLLTVLHVLGFATRCIFWRKDRWLGFSSQIASFLLV